MNFRQLEVLRTLLATGSTIAAAKALGLSQSGVSRLLSQLEADLSMTLFIRDRGRLLPTPEARLLSQDAANVLLALDRFNGHASDMRNGTSGPDLVRIGLPGSMWENFAPAMLVDYVEKFPGVRIETFFESAMAIQKYVEERVIDIGFVRIEGQLHATVEIEEIARADNVCVIPADHPLAQKEEISVKDLNNVPLVMIGWQRPERMILDRLFSKAGARQNVKIETHTNSSACAYVARGLGIAIISSFYANLYKNLPVVHRRFVPRTTHRFGIARAAGVPLSIAAQGLSDALSRQIKLSQTTDS